MLSKIYNNALRVQVFHLVLCILWNLIGIWQISQNIQSIGPTATFIGVIACVLLIIGLVFALNKNAEKIYLSLAALAMLFAMVTIYGGFTKDHNLWPSEFWRYAGIVVNFIGVIGFLIAVSIFIKRK